MTSIYGLTELAEAPASGDLVPLTDVSDTSQSANGSTKKITLANLIASAVNQKSPLHPLAGYAPMSGRTAASLVYSESSGAGTDKPVIIGRSFTQLDGWHWKFRIPQAFTTATLKIAYYMTATNTSKAVIWGASVAAISDTDTGVTAKVFATTNTATVTVPDAIGTEDEASITLTNADSASVGDRVDIVIYRSNAAGDTASGEPVLTFAEVQYA